MSDYCVMKDGDNIAVEYNLNNAINKAIKYNADKILHVFYDKNENETGFETVWEKED